MLNSKDICSTEMSINLMIQNYTERDIQEGFTKKYGVHRLVWYEETTDIKGAIQREKQMKKWRRQWKIDLIEKENPNWDDLYEKLL